jgi:hypothetical protein
MPSQKANRQQLRAKPGFCDFLGNGPIEPQPTPEPVDPFNPDGSKGFKEGEP